MSRATGLMPRGVAIDRPAWAAWVAPSAASVGVAMLARVILGPPHIGYDAWFALTWGQEIAGGHLPSVATRIAPTPHPLLNLVAAVLSLAGAQAPALLASLHFLAYGVLVVATGIIAGRMGGWVGAVLAAALVASRPLLISELLFCSVDVVFLALVACSAVLVTRPATELRGQQAAAALLVAAGLLRPEGWLLAGAYAIWLAARCGWSHRRAAAVALTAPGCWMLADLLATGDPLWSLHQTQQLADRLGRPQSLSTAITVLPHYLSIVTGRWPAVLGALAVVWLARRRGAGRLALAVLGTALAGWLVLGVAGLPLLFRYTLLPGITLLIALAGAVGALLRGPRPTPAVAAGAVAVAALLALQLTADVRTIRQQTGAGRLQLAMERDLDALLRDQRLRDLVARCGAPTVPHYRPVPQIAYRLGIEPSRPAVAAGDASPVLLDPIPSRASAAYRLSAIDRDAFAADATNGTRLVVANAHWALRERCTAP